MKRSAIRRLIIALATTLGLAAGGVIALHASASEAWGDPIVFRVNDKFRCLDVPADRVRENGVPLQIWDCNGQPNQQWRWSPWREDTNGRSLQSPYGMCIDAYRDGGTVAGDVVKQWECVDVPQQQWFLSKRTNGANFDDVRGNTIVHKATAAGDRRDFLAITIATDDPTAPNGSPVLLQTHLSYHQPNAPFQYTLPGL